MKEKQNFDMESDSRDGFAGVKYKGASIHSDISIES